MIRGRTDFEFGNSARCGSQASEGVCSGVVMWCAANIKTTWAHTAGGYELCVFGSERENFRRAGLLDNHAYLFVFLGSHQFSLGLLVV